MAEEKVFFDERGVKVSNSRFITPGQTYTMSGITSVYARELKPSRKGPIIVAVIGLALFAVKWLLGLLVLAAGIAWFVIQKSEYRVFIDSASGTVNALMDKDKNFILQVEQALNDAIVERG